MRPADGLQISLVELTRISSAVRRMGEGASCMEEVACRVVSHLRSRLVDRETGEALCALARFFKTHPYGGLESRLRTIAGDGLDPDTTCLTLLGSAGERPWWNARADSVGHQVIPLPDEKILRRFPMIAQLIHQFGLETHELLDPPAGLLLDAERRGFNVFFVPDAHGSPFIPAQEEFVVPFDIRSVVGFGSMLPTGDVVATILFWKRRLGRESVKMFRTLALSTKVAVLPFAAGRIFAKSETPRC